jgi:hypothetical protein
MISKTKQLLASILLSIACIFSASCEARITIKEQATISRSAIYFNVSDFVAGLITKEYLATQGTVEFDITERVTFGTRMAFIRDNSADNAHEHSLGMYFDYRLFGERDCYWFLRGMVSFKEQSVPSKTVSFKVKGQRLFKFDDKEFYTNDTDSKLVSVDDIAHMFDCMVAIGRKHLFDNRFALQYGVGVTTDKSQLKHFTFDIGDVPMSAIAFIKIGYWI